MAMDISPAELDRARRSLMLGLAQNPLSGADALVTLALVAARSRFTRPHPPARMTAKTSGPALSDPSRFLPDAARAALKRLATGKDFNAGDAIALATMRAVRQSTLGLHPFDYSRLENFIARFAEMLGPAERQWLKAVRPNQKQIASAYDEEMVSEATLAGAGKVQKLAFLKELRRSDPAKARGLIEELLPGEAANVRAELVGLIGLGLAAADKAFLESLAADRAQSVRDAAALLLARTPGTGAYHEKLVRLKDRIDARKAGLLRRRMVFSLRSTPKPNASFDPLHALNDNKELFEGVDLADIAATLGVTPDDLIAGSLDATDLGCLLFRSALLEGRETGLEDFLSLFAGDISHQTVFLFADLLPRLTEGGRKAFLDIAFTPGKWNSLPSLSAFTQLYAALGEPLQRRKAAELLGSQAWRAATSNEGDETHVYRLDEIAPLIPRALSEQFLAGCAPGAHRAQLYHRFLLTLPEPADMRT